MLLFGLILLAVPMVLSNDVEIMKNIKNYVIKIDRNDTLMSIERGAKTTHELNLSNLGLKRIDDNAFNENLSNLERLDLSHNFIDELPQFVFSNLTNLKHLFIAHNKLKYIDKSFAGLDNLQFLDITNNSMTHFVGSSLFGLKKNCDIKIGGNPLQVIATDAFLRRKKKGRNSKNVDKNNEKNHSSRIIPLVVDNGDKIQIVDDDPEYIRGFSTWMDVNSPDYPALWYKNTTVKICINNEIVQRVEFPEKDEILANTCKTIEVNFAARQLSLNQMGVSKLKKGWYRLGDDYPVGTISLAKNEIVQLSAELLNDLPANIQVVSLSGNKITSLKNKTVTNGYLIKLDLSRNLIDDIEPGTFEKTSMRILDLRYNKFTRTEFVKYLPTSLKELLIGSNRINGITSDSFKNLVHLAFLDIRDNEIVKIANNDFYGLSSLQILGLHQNGLRSIEPGSFRHLRQLRELILDDNEISSIERGVFEGLDRMLYLTIRNNKLSEITRDFFYGLGDNLDVLTFNGNHITSLEAGTFVKVPKNYLFLHNNDIRKISPGCFNLSSLSRLGLNDNKLREINAEAFVGLTNLTVLEIMNNEIRKVGKEFGKNMPQLNELKLMGNLIETLESGTFVDVPKNLLLLSDNKISKIADATFFLPTLERLMLSNNRLSELHEQQFIGLDKLVYLDLASNVIKKVKKGFATDLGNVETLNLSGNLIERLENGDFHGLEKLHGNRWILLDSTPVELVQGGLFDDV